jgi:ectoine hydroxylase-related dioxygenase (phytanoyl-CoA dioxygenase family)
MTSSTLVPHGYNTRFAWQDVPRQGGVLDAAMADQFDEQGFCLLRGVLDPALVDTLREEVDGFDAQRTAALAERASGERDISAPDAVTFSAQLVKKSPLLKDFSRSPLFAGLGADLIGPDVRLYWDQAVYKRPEPTRDFPWHQDTGYQFTLPQHYLTCWIPLVDATVENGCPWMAPGLHRLGTLQHWWTDFGWRCLEDAPDAVPVEAKAGDIVCFSSLAPHRTGPNTSSDIRKAYILQYAADGMTAAKPVLQDDEEHQYLVTKAGSPAA